MTRILAKNLSKKKVMLTDGSELGFANDVVIDSRSGDLLYLMVKPNPVVEVSGFDVQDDYIVIPFKAVKAIKDYAIIDKKLITDIEIEQ